ncbi:MAG TPA: DUF1028 domain-containing protein [Solirubrobacteraceae bacterium]|jgi:uncharacterized Ntn-hydrolase superfamily protein|nr:DUF1028 domain-containing protein [Solirubrobacteraceae bacterium]
MTYSIVARGVGRDGLMELGVAVQSHWFGVGSIVPWARPGVGAVATQANAEVAYGPRALDLLERGMSAPGALKRLLAEDSLAASRQVAIVDARGDVAAHTGDACMAFAGDVQGDGVSCQANIMANAEVWPAMLHAYAGARGSLAARLLTALDAAEATGGDLRGRQSAAILIVPAAGDPWATVMSLRVEDHPDPLVELARLARLDEAYRVAGEGDESLAAGRHEEASALFQRACELAPESDELRFWAGLGAAQVGNMDGALAHIRAAIEAHSGWLELLRRLTPELAPSAPAVLAALDGHPGA